MGNSTFIMIILINENKELLIFFLGHTLTCLTFLMLLFVKVTLTNKPYTTINALFVGKHVHQLQ